MRENYALGKYYAGFALLFQTTHMIRLVATKMFKPLGISPMEVGAMRIIKGNSKPTKPIDLARLSLRRTASVSTLVNMMQRDGLVRRVKDLDRKNLVRLELTEKGEEVFQQAWDIAITNKAIQRILRALSEEQYQQLISSLNILMEKALEELEAEYEFPFT